MDDDDDTQVYKDHGDALTIAYQSGYYDGKKAAQPAQEPDWEDQYEKQKIRYAFLVSEVETMPITTPPQRTWVGLTDEQIQDCDPHEDCWHLFKIARAIEAKLKEKNT